MPEVIPQLAQQAQLIKVARSKTTQREPFKIGAAGEEHDQQNAQQEAGNRVQNGNNGTAHHIKMTAVANRFADSQGNRNQINQQGAPEAERDRDRQLFDDQIQHAGVTVKTFTEVQYGIVFQHDPETLMGWLIEPVHHLDAFDDLRWKATGGVVF